MAIIYGTQGTPDDDIIYGTDANDDMDGGTGKDTIYGGTGNDTITSNYKGNKIFVGGEGNDFLFGQLDEQHVAVYAGALSNFTIEVVDVAYSSIGYFSKVTDKTGIEGADRLFLIDEMQFSDTNLYWVGDHWSKTQRMTEGDDSISLKNFGDMLSGRGGDDYIRGNGGNDTLSGGVGNDTLIGGADNDWLEAGAGDNIVYGGSGNDTLMSRDYGNDILHGDEGDDYIFIGNASTLTQAFGDSGNDTLYGISDSGTIKLRGGDGNDTLAGGGKLYLEGGAGQDIFSFDNFSTGKITLLDFTHGEDTIALDSSQSGFYSFADVISHAVTNVRGDTVITTTETESPLTIIINGVEVTELVASDFTFTS